MIPLGGLLAMLEVERRTGLVRISTMRGTVGLELASGCVARGSFQGEMVAPIDAMRALVNVHEGPFSFHALTPRLAPPDAPPIHQLLRAAGRATREGFGSEIEDPPTPSPDELGRARR